VLTPSTVTLASRAVPALRLLRPLRLPTVRLVAVAPVTVPVTLLLKVTTSLLALVAKSVPLIVMLVELDGRLVVLAVTVGAKVAEKFTLAIPKPGLLVTGEEPLSQKIARFCPGAHPPRMVTV